MPLTDQVFLDCVVQGLNSDMEVVDRARVVGIELGVNESHVIRVLVRLKRGQQSVMDGVR